MRLNPPLVLALAVLVIATGSVLKALLNAWLSRGEGTRFGSERLMKMEERISRIEDATSTLVAEFAAVRERERFMTQLVESRARKDARALAETALPAGVSPPVAGSEPSPFVVQTVSAVRRTTHPGNTG
jgi:hypothetical protein